MHIASKTLTGVQVLTGIRTPVDTLHMQQQQQAEVLSSALLTGKMQV